MGRRPGRKERNKHNRHRFIFERDSWTCMMPVCYCPDGRQLDSRLGPGDPWSPTVDHIVPVATGGTNDRRNLRAAHQLCNVKHAHKLSVLLGRERGY